MRWDAACRGGNTKSIKGGIYEITAKLLGEMKSGMYGVHPANVGNLIAYEIGRESKIPIVTMDRPVTDELCDYARFSGIPQINRQSSFHALNQKATARKVAKKLGKSDSILVGSASRIRNLLDENQLKEKNTEIIHASDHEAAAEKSIDLAIGGRCDVVMKGNLHTSTFLKAVLNKEAGFRKGSLITQISVYDKFYGEGLQLLTDCAMAISSTLEEKKSIIENAVELSIKIGYENRRLRCFRHWRP